MEHDVVELAFDEGDSQTVLVMTKAQVEAYQAREFAPTYLPGEPTEVRVNEFGDPIEVHDVTSHPIPQEEGDDE
jgi:hypothetical protein